MLLFLRRASFAFLLLASLWPGSARAQVITAMGDSITVGFGLASPSTQNWTVDLLAKLPNTYSMVDLGESGSTLQLNPVQGPSYQHDNSAAIATAINNSNIFFIMLGTNDGNGSNKTGTTSHYVADYKALLDQIRNGSTKNPIIYLLTPPPAFSNTYGVDATFVNGTVKGLVESLDGYDGARVLDINDALMSTFSDGNGGYSTTYVQDGLHPTAAGAQLIANTVYTDVFAAPEPGTNALLLSAGAAFLLYLAARRRACRGPKSVSPGQST